MYGDCGRWARNPLCVSGAGMSIKNMNCAVSLCLPVGVEMCGDFGH